MELWQKLRMQFNDFFHANYPYIALYSGLGVAVTAYLHYQWSVHHYDLMYWKRLAEVFSQDIDCIQLAILLLIFAINAIFVFIILSVYMRPALDNGSDMSLVEIKDRYARFILLRLIARLDRIQSKISAKRKSLTFQHYVRAHTNMVKAVAVFRKDARKLILPNESEILMPIEDIYGVADDEERLLRRSGYYKLIIDTTDETVKSLFNAKLEEILFPTS
ncbi:uncharacterized protein LOC27206217 [Drosophila simulans]|uniref:GD12421 n=1 Tax=Drosophila simulans TaxID=7240 RepID=B4QNF7_DROSI|nr:uncharacterized protein LOC27206217 [Drosophila simulans]EDX10827.1 GD12421 [Drosophila simulans]KMZ00204.1 uncharacterized protein Dsimw501_GD12421 [Drosophila simulans]